MLCTISRARKVVFVVYLICFMATITTPFEWTAEITTNPITNTSNYEIASSVLGKAKIYKTVYYWFTSIAFVNICEVEPISPSLIAKIFILGTTASNIDRHFQLFLNPFISSKSKVNPDHDSQTEGLRYGRKSS